MSSIKIPYSSLRDIPLEIELSLPTISTPNPLPLVIFFHGGALFTGNKKDVLFAGWLQDAALARGFAFAGVDYPLLHPFTAKDQINQVKKLFSFLASPELNSFLPSDYSINANRVAVTGFSAGGYIARLAAIHAEPKPVAVLSAYGMGGSFLSDTYVHGNKVFPIDIPKEAVDRILEDKETKPVVSGSPAIFDPVTKGVSDNTGRWQAALWAIVNGVYLDYLTGIPNFSKELQAIPAADRHVKVNNLGLADLFPEILLSTLSDSSAFPPTFLYHGGADPLILPAESIATHEALKKAGVKTELVVVPHAVHGMIDPKKGAPALEATEVQAKAFEFIAVELSRV